jgi:hypothetical protein
MKYYQSNNSSIVARTRFQGESRNYLPAEERVHFNESLPLDGRRDTSTQAQRGWKVDEWGVADTLKA